jgi:lipopolysaccharide cholinephosphotransferase
VVSIQNTPVYYATFAKIIDTRTVMYEEYGFVNKVEIGVYIDIFPMDGIPDDETDSKKVFAQLKRWIGAYRLSIRKFTAKSSNPFKWVAKTLMSVPFRIIGSHFFITKLEALGMVNSYDESASVACITSEADFSRRIERRLLEESILVEFEGEMYPAPSECDRYLTQLYGDYMKPPPENQRQQHYYTVFWK